MRRLNPRIYLSGALRVNVADEARRKAERDKTAQQVKSAIEQIESIRVRVHHLTRGMLDFPSIVYGQRVLLCWRLGEPNIVHWRGEGHDSADMRKLVKELFGNPERKRQN
jgi:hypothetical protein